MDDELKGTAAAATGEMSSEENGEVSEEARILSNLLQSLDAGSGGSGPVYSMMKAMGNEPPLVTTEETQDQPE